MAKGQRSTRKTLIFTKHFKRWQPHLTENLGSKLHLVSLHPSLILFVLPTHDASPQTKIHTHYHTYSKPYARPNKGQDDKVPPQDCRQMPRRPSKKLPSRGVTKKAKVNMKSLHTTPDVLPNAQAQFSQSALYGGVVKTKRSSEIS